MEKKLFFIFCILFITACVIKRNNTPKKPYLPRVNQDDFVGAWFDEHEDKIRLKLRNTGVLIKRNKRVIRLILPSDITFSTGTANIKPYFYPILDSVIVILKEYRNTLVEVAGHTDSIGRVEYNHFISQNRANMIARYLKKRGIEYFRIQAIGYGEAKPRAGNGTPEGRELNRRIEILIVAQ